MLLYEGEYKTGPMHLTLRARDGGLLTAAVSILNRANYIIMRNNKEMKTIKQEQCGLKVGDKLFMNAVGFKETPVTLARVRKYERWAPVHVLHP